MVLLIIIGFILGYLWGGNEAKKQLAKLRSERQQFVEGLKQLELSYKKEGERHVIRRLLADFGIAAQTKPGTDKADEQETADEFAIPNLSAPQVSANKAASNQLSTPALARSSSIDNITLLLYFGAFLFSAAVGLFIAFGGLPGTVRTFLVAVVILAFYFCGIAIFQASKKLRLAGLTFIAIGMVLLPFLGLAAHNFIFDMQAGPLVWGLTSLLAIAMYLHALFTTRQAFVTYFMLGAVLSLFESGVAITDLPVFYFAWIMALVGIIFMVVAKLKGIWPELYEPLNNVSNILVPIALVFSLVFAVNQGLLQTSICLALGALYYGLAAYIGNKEQRVLYIGLADALGFSALGLGVWSITETLTTTSYVLLATALVQAIVLLALFGWDNIRLPNNPTGRKLEHELHQAFNIVTVSVCIIAGLLVITTPVALICELAIFIGVVNILYVSSNDESMLALGCAAWLLIPGVLGLYVLKPILTWQTLSMLYFCATLPLLGLRILAHDDKKLVDIFRVSYLVSFALVLLAAIAGGVGSTAIACLVITLCLGCLSYYEKSLELWAGALLLLFVAAGTGLASQEIVLQTALPIVMGILSVGLFIVGAVSVFDSERSKYLRYAGLAGLAVGAASVMSFGTTTIPMIVNLGMLAVLGYVEAESQKSLAGQELAGGIGMVTLQWLLGYSDVINIILFSQMWAALFALYAYERNASGDNNNEKVYTTVALCFFTIPIVFKALGDSGQYYGWLLIAEQIGLILFGMMISRPFVIKWGLTVAVCAVLYQLRDLTFFVLGLVGLGIIGLAIYLLSKQADDHNNMPPPV